MAFKPTACFPTWTWEVRQHPFADALLKQIHSHKCRPSTDNNVGTEGAIALANALQSNSTLMSLNLGRKQNKADNEHMILCNTPDQTGNDICGGGARALAEMLKVNTSLARLCITGESHVKETFCCTQHYQQNRTLCRQPPWQRGSVGDGRCAS